MHELSIAQSLMEMANGEAQSHGAKSVTCLRCRIGVFRQVDKWLLREAFEIASQGTICQASRLQVEETYPRSYCPNCNARFTISIDDLICPTCQTKNISFNGGDELELVSIDIVVDKESTRTAHPNAICCTTGVNP